MKKIPEDKNLVFNLKHHTWELQSQGNGKVCQCFVCRNALIQALGGYSYKEWFE